MGEELHEREEVERRILDSMTGIGPFEEFVVENVAVEGDRREGKAFMLSDGRPGESLYC